MIDYFRGKGSERRGTGGITAGVAGAMQELDRIMTRWMPQLACPAVRARGLYLATNLSIPTSLML